MGRPKKATLRHVDPEDMSQEIPEEQGALESTPPEESGGGINKTEAVRRAIAAGHDSPASGVPYIRREFGIEIGNQTFSSYKAQQKARDARKGGTRPAARPGRKPKAASDAAEGHPAPPPNSPDDGGMDLLDAMEAMKPLIASLGAEKVKRIVDLLG